MTDRAATFPLQHNSSSYITGCSSSSVSSRKAFYLTLIVLHLRAKSFFIFYHPVGPPSTYNYMPSPLPLSTAASNYTCYALLAQPTPKAAEAPPWRYLSLAQRHPVSDFLISALRRRRNGHFDGLRCQEVGRRQNHSIDITLLWHRLKNPLASSCPSDLAWSALMKNLNT